MSSFVKPTPSDFTLRELDASKKVKVTHESNSDPRPIWDFNKTGYKIVREKKMIKVTEGAHPFKFACRPPFEKRPLKSFASQAKDLRHFLRKWQISLDYVYPR